MSLAADRRVAGAAALAPGKPEALELPQPLRVRLWHRRTFVSGASARAGVLGALVPVAVMTLIALAAPLLATHTARGVTAIGPLHGPSLSYPFGTDDIGRDVFSRVLYGIRESWLGAWA